MLNETQEKAVKEIYQDYQRNVKPLIYYVERKYHRFPKSLLNEIRDVFDHLSRCYCTDIELGIEDTDKEKYINDNIEKAENHFTRIKLDAYKYVNDFKERDFKKWKRKYSKYDLQNIDNGVFWENILQLEELGEELFSLAKAKESKNIEEAYELFVKSTEKYDEIEDLIRKKQKLILKAKMKYRRISFLNTFFTFIIGIVTGVIASIIYAEMIQPLLR